MESDNLEELFDDLYEEQKAKAVNMSIDEYRAQVDAERKRQRLDMVGLNMAQRIAQEEAANLSKGMSPLQAQKLMISKA